MIAEKSLDNMRETSMGRMKTFRFIHLFERQRGISSGSFLKWLKSTRVGPDQDQEFNRDSYMGDRTSSI